MIAKLLVLLIIGSLTWACVSGTCTTEDIQRCMAPVAQWTNGALPNPTTKAELDDVCKKTKTLLDCIRPCVSANQGANGTFHIAYAYLKETCTETQYCFNDLKTCASPTLNVTNIPVSVSGLTGQQCKNYGNLARCYKNQIPNHCKAINAIDNIAQKFFHVHYECLKSCPALSACGQALYIGVTTGAASAACGLFQTFLDCVTGARCDGMMVDRPPREPQHFADLKSLVQEGCAVMETEKAALYSCVAFQTCITQFLETVDNLRPDRLCGVIQGMMRCAVDHSNCANVRDVAGLKKKAFNFMLKAGIQGCGDPKFDVNDLGSCSALQTCKTNLQTGANPSFVQICNSAATFATCASASAGSCNLTPPDNLLPARPMLSNMRSSVQALCEALSGEPAAQCADWTSCMGQDVDFLTSGTVGQLLNPNNWCSAGLRAVRCLEAYEISCEVSEQFKTKLQAVRNKFVSISGCQNEYTDNTSAGSAVGGYMLMMVMLLFPAVLF